MPLKNAEQKAKGTLDTEEFPKMGVVYYDTGWDDYAIGTDEQSLVYLGDGVIIEASSVRERIGHFSVVKGGTMLEVVNNE